MTERFTILLPTRQRADTLESALRTCISQDLSDLDILVSDNASTDETRGVVAGFDDSRIRYINPGRRLGMSEHWEFALSHVANGYFTIIGDDDGVMPGGIARARTLMEEEGADALIWPLTAYYWPRYADPALADHVSVRVPTKEHVGFIDAKQTLEKVAHFRLPHYWLPSPYWGAVHTRTIERSRAKDGRFFRSITPDLYAGTAIASTSQCYLRTNRPLTLSGSSHHSNGASALASARQGQRADAREQYISENSIPFHPDLKFAGSIPIVLTEALLQTRDSLERDVPVPDLETLVRAALRHPELVFNPRARADVEQTLRAIGDLRSDSSRVEDLIRHEGRFSAVQFLWAGLANVLTGNPVHACPPEVQNIDDATKFVDSLLHEGDRLGVVRINTRGRLAKVLAAGRVARGRLT
ncbi:hypothetical protein ACVW00_001740 [Marmoricola sp. URHA0025 HA25]